MQQATTAPGLDRSLAERISHETYYQTVFRRFRRHRPGFISLIFQR